MKVKHGSSRDGLLLFLKQGMTMHLVVHLYFLQTHNAQQKTAKSLQANTHKDTVNDGQTETLPHKPHLQEIGGSVVN